MKRGQPIHSVTDPHNTMLNGYVHFRTSAVPMTLSGTSKMESPELIELLAAARAFLPSDDVAFVYHDADAGESYRTCCHAVYRLPQQPQRQSAHRRLRRGSSGRCPCWIRSGHLTARVHAMPFPCLGGLTGIRQTVNANPLGHSAPCSHWRTP